LPAMITRKTETLNLRVSPEFKKRLQEKAASQRRSVTNYVETTLGALWEEESGPKQLGPTKGKSRT
jgi:hypothetical protein